RTQAHRAAIGSHVRSPARESFTAPIPRIVSTQSAAFFSLAENTAPRTAKVAEICNRDWREVHS
ncbi:MAG: hypothetical protein ACYDBH_17515, partial [Acidobacteriaceae bacterium]